MITRSISFRLIVSVAIGFAIGALSSRICAAAHDDDFTDRVTSNCSSDNAARQLPTTAARGLGYRSQTLSQS